MLRLAGILAVCGLGIVPNPLFSMCAVLFGLPYR